MTIIIKSYDIHRKIRNAASGKSTTGKTIHTNPLFFSASATHGKMFLQACDSESRSSGERGGQEIEIKRDTEISLDPEDLKKIFDAALAAGLLRPEFAIPRK